MCKCLYLIVKYVTRATFNICMCSFQCHYIVVFVFNNTKSNGIRKFILQQYRSRPTSCTCNLVGKICVLPNRVSYLWWINRSFGIRVMGRRELCIIADTATFIMGTYMLACNYLTLKFATRVFSLMEVCALLCAIFR